MDKWPHFPHCPECHERLWAKNGGLTPAGFRYREIVPPTADGRCPHCGRNLNG